MRYVVIDTNVIVSALLAQDRRRSVPFAILEAVFLGKITPVLSKDIMAEYVSVLNRAKFGFNKELVKTILVEIKAQGVWVNPEKTGKELPDQKDVCFYEAATIYEDMAEDDAATANWGSDWRMPTKEEWQELYTNTTHTRTTQNGVNGRLFTASNGNSLFLPAAGNRWVDVLYGTGSYGYYWLSSLNTGDPYNAWSFYFGSSGPHVTSGVGRFHGKSVRAVRSSRQN